MLANNFAVQSLFLDYILLFRCGLSLLSIFCRLGLFHLRVTNLSLLQLFCRIFFFFFGLTWGSRSP
ncbi:hypothetical protein GGU10DRAFT_344186 [Lentinula aff. detonsa]|uniref:Uncharacterized protein n=1 Tax=Lentinula aff. detonsa TaxID=2804958 RepID=A0AA38TZB7_9AGAR|nr:hypothetical protein GGU10DRAFT_344186 [Lentinula aff. detonsa]